MFKKEKIFLLFLIISLSFNCFIFSQTKDVKLRLSTTTSTEDSGLLKYLLPEFEKKTGIKIDVIAVGTGKALKLGEDGNVDVVLVHAKQEEDKFVAKGYGVNRKDVMYNHFIIIGPKNDPAGIKKAKTAFEAFKIIFDKQVNFISRGDKSGTDIKEKEIWAKLNISPKGSWYKEAGQGMSEVINMANNQLCYTFTDIATYLFMKSKVDLVSCFEGDQILFNPYGVIAVNPEKWPNVKYKEAIIFINWITSKEGQELIKNYKIDGLSPFIPDAK